MGLLRNSFIALALALPVLSQTLAGPYQQCGGQGWTGPTQCVAGYVCSAFGDYYSQCVPGSASTPPVTSTPTPTPTVIEPPPPQGCPTLPPTLSLTPNAKLPDPLTFFGSTRKIVNKDEWFCRRNQIVELFQRYELGVLPDRPQSVSGTLSGNTLTVNVGHNGRSISFTADIIFPSGNGPFPAIIGIGGSSILTPAGIALITFNNDDIAEQINQGSRGKGKFYTLYGSDHSASALTAWTWGVSRIIDALQGLGPTTSKIDTGKLAVTGCSRSGRGAFVAGALDQRISLTIPQESGAGGAGCWRISDALSKEGVETQTAKDVVDENVWFASAFDPYVNRIADLPVDHHLLAALVAPRGLFVIENSAYPWLGPQSTFGCMKAGRKVYQALGIADRMGISQVGGHGHCQFPGAQVEELLFFIDKFLRGNLAANTNIVRTDLPNDAGFDEAKWVDWPAPALADGPPSTGNPPVTTPNPPVTTPNPPVTTPNPPVTTPNPPVTTPNPPVTTPNPPAACPTLPASPPLTANSKLNDPFTFFNGQKVTTKADWYCRREEISQLFQKFELGELPPKPQSVTGSLSGNTLSVQVSHNGQSISFSASISFPSGNGPFPALIGVGGSSLPAPSGVASINFPNNDLAAQDNTGSRGRGKFYTLYGTNHTASAMMAWVWGVSRMIDVLETVQNSRIDMGKLAVTGCSRNGKGAMVVGAFEQRIALVIPQESGSGGAACWRISDAMSKNGVNTQTAQQIVTENVWFSPLFNQYVTRVNDLPFDHHLLAALVAPRGLLVIDHSGIDWLGPQSVFGCMKTATKVFQALGIPERMGVSQIGGHNHCAFPSSQQNDLNAFVDKFLRGNLNANTSIVRTDASNNAGFVESNWVDWTVPTLS